MIIAVDAYYRGPAAKVVSIEFLHWEDEHPQQINVIEFDGFADYIPGEFYRRELPGIHKVLEKSDLNGTETILIDGYVILDDRGKWGLGGYLFHELNEKISVIGVAKTRFKNNVVNVRKVYRGISKRPLFITSMGMELENAVNRILKMGGNSRIPVLLKILDRETKK
jgi:deoxyribonuclease V